MPKKSLLTIKIGPDRNHESKFIYFKDTSSFFGVFFGGGMNLSTKIAERPTTGKIPIVPQLVVTSRQVCFLNLENWKVEDQKEEKKWEEEGDGTSNTD